MAKAFLALISIAALITIIAASIFTLQPVAQAWVNKVNIEADIAKQAADISAGFSTADLDVYRGKAGYAIMMLPVTEGIKYAYYVLFSVFGLVAGTLFFYFLMRKMVHTMSNLSTPWITIQQQLPVDEIRRLRLSGSRNYYRYLAGLYRQASENRNLPEGEKQIILAYLAALMRARRSEHLTQEEDPYFKDYDNE